MRLIDPDEVYQRALSSGDWIDGLDAEELLVYAVKELETYISMQGWSGFFTGSCSELHPDVRRCLELSGAARSLAILDDYAAYLASIGVAFDADAIEEWERSEASRASALPDWGQQFKAAHSERWQSIRRYLSTRNIELVETARAEPGRTAAFAAELAALISASDEPERGTDDE